MILSKAVRSTRIYWISYLTLNRVTTTLSGGEAQRLKLIRHLNSSLSDLVYIIDEPSVGLHPEDIAKINEILKSLKDKGNTVLIVEHDPDVIKEGDYIIDMGPGSGKTVVKSHLKEHIMNYYLQILLQVTHYVTNII